MNTARLSAETGKLIQRESLNPELTRALRGMTAFVAPLIICQIVGVTDDAYFAAIGAQVVALTDVRGAYRFRLVILLVIAAIITSATLLGSLTGAHAVAAVLAMGLLALLSGLWRHLSWDYGPGLGAASALLFIVAIAQPAGHEPGWQHAAFTLAGALWGIGLQAMLWPFRPQHALRHAVAESWMAVSELFAAMQPAPARSPREQDETVTRRERELRGVLDRTYGVLSAAEGGRSARLVTHLQELHLAGARLGTRAVALNASLESLSSRPDSQKLAASIDSLLLALTNLTRSIALTTITHRPENFALSDVRLRRCSGLIRVLSAHLEAMDAGGAETAMPREILRQIDAQLTVIEQALKETVDRGGSGPGFPLRLPDLSVFSLRALSSWANPSHHFDPVLVRHTLRMLVLTMLAMAIYRGFDIPRGYWIALTVIMVLQPDYGSTRKRAGQRILGTLAGSLLASAFLWVRMPLPLLDLLIGATVFGFAYYQKQRYGIAVFCITLMLVLLTETSSAVHLDFTLDRLLCSLGGGVLALVGALIFWPTWERERFPLTMAAAIRANRDYLEKVTERLFAGTAFDAKAVHVKRSTESANSNAAASLQRMLAEPAGQRHNVELSATLVHSNTRITRALTVLMTNIRIGERLDSAELSIIATKTGEIMESLAAAIATESQTPAGTPSRLAALDKLEIPPETGRHELIRLQLGKIATELSAMALAMSQSDQPVKTPLSETADA
ncbi:MAG: FUSC family protein [Opitutaceae bacterium]|jgi:uncharacterized membrane protein YccC